MGILDGKRILVAGVTHGLLDRLPVAKFAQEEGARS